jgi:hypothetical protein
MSSYSNLKFEIIDVGGSDGAWGGITNTNIGTAIEQAIVGMATLESGDFSTNVATLSASNTPSAQDFRAFCLNITATLTAAGTVNVPAIEKPYLVLNNSVGGYAVTVKVSGQTGVAVPNGKACLVYNNGTDVGAAITHLTSLTLASPLAVTSGGTGTTSTTFVNLATNVTGTLPVANGGTGTTTPGLVQGSNITITGTWPNQTIAAASPGTGTVTSVSGTGSANGLSLSGTVTSSGNITLGGSVTSLTTTNFSISESGGILVFKYGSTTIATMDSSGNLTTLANMTAYGSI